MAYPNTPIQRVDQRYYDAGFVGQIALIQNNTFYFDTATASVELKPGYGVYLETAAGPTLGEWVVPAGGSEDLVTHIVSYEQSGPTQALAVPVGNQTSEIVYPADTPVVKAMAQGAIYVQLGAAVVRGQFVQFDATADNYILNTFGSASRVLMVALDSGGIGDVIAVRIEKQQSA